MKKIVKNILTIAAISASSLMISACAPSNTQPTAVVKPETSQQNDIAELNPFDENIQQKLQDMDQQYYDQTGQNPFDSLMQVNIMSGCMRMDCKVFALIKKSEQKLYLYVDQQLISTWAVSTGDANHETPLLDVHPDGRIYDQYSSTKFPGGDFNGLGNMPYAVFLYNGFAIHGTPPGNWKNLGKKASHGCVRSHPDNALTFNLLVRQYGVNAVWVQIIN